MTTPSILRQFALIGMLAVIAMPFNAVAQTPAAESGFIIVTAEGSATAPAEGADVAIVLASDTTYPDPMSVGTPPSPATGGLDPQPVVDTLVKHGVVADNIQVSRGAFPGEWGQDQLPGPVTILLSVDAPSPASLQTLLDATLSAAHENNMFVNSFTVMYTISDCAALRRDARADAVANARVEAEAQATAMEMDLGRATGSRDVPLAMTSPYTPSNCGPAMDVVISARAYMMMPFDPQQPAEVRVTVNLEVTFDAE